MARRVYEFELPYRVGGFSLAIGFNLLAEFWSDLPLELQQRALQARDSWGGELVITAEDLDKIPDATWIKMADRFNLKWHQA